MGKRRDRFNQRQVDQARSRSRNAPLKYKERQRRDARMRQMIAAGRWPYDRVIRNWLSVQLGKKERDITETDIQQLLAKS